MNKREETVKGIVLRQIEYNDNAAIISVLSKKGELLSLYARGVKKVTSKNASAVMVFVYSDFEYFFNQKGLHTLKRAKVLNNYFDKFSDYNKIIVAFMLLDIVFDVANLDTMANPDLFKLLINSFEMINEIDETLLLTYFLIEVMKSQGIELIADQCAICQSKKINYISIENGGFICHKCLANSNNTYNKLEMLQLFRSINIITMQDLNVLDFSQNDYKSMLLIIYEFYTSYTGLKVKNFEKLQML